MTAAAEPLSVAAYVAQLEAENATLKERVASFEAGLESEIMQRVEARDAERKKSFKREVEGHAVALMSRVGQPNPLSADVTGGDKPGTETGLARFTAYLRARRESR